METPISVSVPAVRMQLRAENNFMKPPGRDNAINNDPTRIRTRARIHSQRGLCNPFRHTSPLVDEAATQNKKHDKQLEGLRYDWELGSVKKFFLEEVFLGVGDV